MRKHKKLLSILLTGAIAVTSLFSGGITATAESTSGGLELISAEVTHCGEKWKNYEPLGQDLYIVGNDVYRIDDDVTDQWIETGKLEMQKITLGEGVDLRPKHTELSVNGQYTTNVGMMFEKGDYANIRYSTSTDETNLDYVDVVKYNKAANSIELVYTNKNKENTLAGATSDGYISEIIINNETHNYDITITSPEGKTVKSFELKYEGVVDGSPSKAKIYPFGYNRNDYIAYAIWGEVYYIIKKDGNLIQINGPFHSIYEPVGNFVPMVTPWADLMYFYSANKSDIRIYDTLFDSDHTEKYGYSEYKVSLISTDMLWAIYEDGNCVLVKWVTNDKYPYSKIASKWYNFIHSSDDGETYLVRDNNDKWGYLDKDGNEILAPIYDDASDFVASGKYAPIINGGKLSLINREFKTVSKSLTFGKDYSAVTLGSRLFRVSNGSKTYLVTYTGNEPEKEVKSISVTAPKSAPKLYTGDNFDPTGYTLKVTYDDNSTEDVDLTADMISGYDKTKSGNQTLTVTYGDKTAWFTVTVREKEIESTDIFEIGSLDYPTIASAVKQIEKDVKAKNTFENGYTIVLPEKFTEVKAVTFPDVSITLRSDSVSELTVPSITAKGSLMIENVTVKTAKGAAAAVTVKKSFTADNSAFGKTKVSGHADISDCTIDGALTLSEKTGETILTNVTVKGKVTAANTLTLDNCTMGAVTSKGTLTVNGGEFEAITVSAKNGTTKLNGDIKITKNLSVSNDLVIDGNSEVGGKFTAKAALSINGFTVKNGK